MTLTQWLVIMALVLLLVGFVGHLTGERRLADRLDRIERAINDVEQRQYDLLLPIRQTPAPAPAPDAGEEG